MSQVNDRDVEAIRDWLAKEPSLPKTFDDLTLRKFLFSCHCSLERTKNCIEEFCTRRSNMPEVYTNRDPMSKRMQGTFSSINVTTYMAGKDEILIHRMVEITKDFDFYDCLKAFTVMADNWIELKMDVLPENHIVILDMNLYTLSLVSKINIFYFQKFLLFLLESMPVRLKQVHAVNCPSFYEYLYNLVKPALPDYLVQMIKFHTDPTGLHKYMDKKYLPKEYGGEAESMSDQHATWLNDIYENRKHFMNDDFWKADLSKKPKKNGVETTAMSGSFRTLAID
ncbi:alpha-tocopherol transfer protein-like [Anticarsia gemmatalis]|uniref:alpha-tocopherol transfer protein-like n=1 Tax=Anticarsia gemmatalis TaxID=129554 RepID=UPI003F76E01A